MLKGRLFQAAFFMSKIGRILIRIQYVKGETIRNRSCFAAVQHPPYKADGDKAVLAR
jgi:hypothetical protein